MITQKELDELLTKKTENKKIDKAVTIPEKPIDLINRNNNIQDK